MRCNKVLERLDDHVDGLLPAPQAEAIRDHLDACTECRETAMALRAATTSLAKWHDVELPSDCFAKIEARIAALPSEALRRPASRMRLARVDDESLARFRRVATGALAAAAAVLGAVYWSRSEAAVPHRALRTPSYAMTASNRFYLPSAQPR